MQLATSAALQAVAPAKVNLALHVVGQREDGYHLLNSLVAFAVGAADRVTVAFGEAETPRLRVTGPFAGEVPGGPSNLVLRAAQAVGGVASVWLTKSLPVAAGVGGGSADAAAVLRAVAHGRGVAPSSLAGVALALGADVPMCLSGRPALVAGIGEVLTDVALPSVEALLVNPRVPVSTQDVFRRLAVRENQPLPTPPPLADADALASWLAAARNDLEAPAIALVPAIATALDALRATQGCLLARMSGSGATVVALYGDAQSRDGAAAAIGRDAPSWWVAPVRLAGAHEEPAPVLPVPATAALG
ncbi:4-(cytidine 5'-diphospho)-2-C-methyl-D-erythritol kinase [Acuticoccus sp.]|uniref:4-(cytidine 5'-diphospho)-2-C-methyl-D-erythritol kinase n=1 Tax=Acuticoccus sp. TaxID=1904378 RepID=UPI003B520A6C